MRTIMRAVALAAAIALVPAGAPAAGQAKAQRPGAAAKPRAAAPAFFTTPLTRDELAGKQAVIETSMGRVVIDLLPDQAPNHVGYFIKLARDGAYEGTTFHRLVGRGIIQGGDPLSRDPAKRETYGTGGLGVLQAEPGAGAHVRGAVAAVLVPGRRDSAGAQFFVCVTPQPALDGQFTVFGRVAEGIGVVTRISEAPVDAAGRAVDRITIDRVTIRDAPPPVSARFADETPEQLAAYRAILETSLGDITIAFMPDRAPNHVRHFLRLAAAGVVDGTAFHRVVPGFVIQTGYLGSSAAILDDAQLALARPQAPEFSDTPHEAGIVSMARGEDPASATTSFFIVTGRAQALDGKYTAFGRVVDGMEVVRTIERAPLTGEAPVTRIELRRIRIVAPG